MSSGSVGRRVQERRRSWNGDYSMDDFIQHDDLAVSSTFLERLPLKIFQHCCDTALLVVISLHKSGRTSLDHFNFRDELFGMGVPDRRRVLNNWADIGLVCSLLYAGRAFPQVALKEAKCTVTLLADGVDMVFPVEISLEDDSKVLCFVKSAEGRPVDGIRGCSDDGFSLV